MSLCYFHRLSQLTLTITLFLLLSVWYVICRQLISVWYIISYLQGDSVRCFTRSFAICQLPPWGRMLSYYIHSPFLSWIVCFPDDEGQNCSYPCQEWLCQTTHSVHWGKHAESDCNCIVEWENKPQKTKNRIHAEATISFEHRQPRI